MERKGIYKIITTRKPISWFKESWIPTFNVLWPANEAQALLLCATEVVRSVHDCETGSKENVVVAQENILTFGLTFSWKWLMTFPGGL